MRIGNLILNNHNCGDSQFSRIAEILKRQFREHLQEASTSTDCICLTAAIEEGIGTEGYRIEHHNDGTTIVGNDILGLYYGVGRYLHEGTFSDRQFVPGDFSGISVPERRIRGMYLANPGWNWYGYSEDDAVRFYIEDLLLWGCNSIMVISPGPVDQQEYRSGHKSSGSRNTYVSRVTDIVAWSNELGMTTAALIVSNISWEVPRPDMLADWIAGKNGYYRNLAAHMHLETCPSAEGGLEFILDGQMASMQWFIDSPPTYICLWPYDAGGCTCADCAPWGGNGFLRIAKALSGLLREKFPESAIMLSTWYFDHFTTGEYALLRDELQKDSSWTDLLMAHFGEGVPPEFIEGMPGKLPVVDFQEISMYGMVPYGGFGANPIPARVQSYHDNGVGIFDGGYPYSEGCYDDINKICCLGLDWGGSGDAYRITRTYCMFEFGQCGAEAYELVCALEAGTIRTHYDDAGVIQDYPQPSQPIVGRSRFVIEHTDQIDNAYALAMSINGKLPEVLRLGWRWQILFLRAVIDYELLHNDFFHTERADQAFESLIILYGGQSSYYSTPPSRRVIVESKGIYNFA